MEVERPRYLNQLIDKKDNGRVKIITGVRRCGKSYLLFELYRKYLLSIGINENQIIMIALDSLKNVQYRNPIELDDFLREKIRDNVLLYYIFIDEIQEYPQLLTLLKPLNDDDKYRYICSGSSLGISLSNTTLIPMGSIVEKKMYPMDFEE